MRSLAPHDVASFKSVSTASIYSQSGITVREPAYKNREVTEADEGKESDDGSQTESEPDDSVLSRGFGIIEALAFPSTDGGGEVSQENHTNWRVLERSVSGEVDMPIEHTNTSSPRVGNAMNSSPGDSPPWNDTIVTPTVAQRQNTAIGGPSIVLSPVETEQSAQTLHQAETRHIETPQFTLFDTSHRVNISPSPAPPQAELPSGPYALVRELESLLGHDVVSQYIHLPTILGAHDACPAPSPTSPSRRAATVFSAPLCVAAHYASFDTVFGGQTHLLPIVVFAAIEELYRVGLKTPILLRPGPSSETPSPSLVAAFDTGPFYGDGVDLSAIVTARSTAPLDDISALLLTYLDCLPGPILVGPLLPALLRFSVRSQTSSNIKAAQLLLRLLPTPHFSLLVYILAFLAQISLYGDLNAWTVEGVAVEFSGFVCGPCEDGEGQEVLEWLLRNWDALSAGLFPRARPAFTDAGTDPDERIASLERKHVAALRAAYDAGAAAERSMWVKEVQALRNGEKVQESIVGQIMKRIVERAPAPRSA